jgi:thiol-disulfide isomerase/thioredoxin
MWTNRGDFVGRRGPQMNMSREGRIGDSPIAVLAILAVVGGVLYLAIQWANTPGGRGATPAMTRNASDPMNYGWWVRDPEGMEIAMTRFEGKVMFLNLWEYWCPPCRAELPSIQRLHDRMSEESDVVVLPVYSESPAGAARVLEQLGLTLPIYAVTGQLPASLEPRAIPTTYIVDRDGTIVFKKVGAAAWDSDSVVDFLLGLAREEPQ